MGPEEVVLRWRARGGEGGGEGSGVDMRTGQAKQGGENRNGHTLSLIHSALGRF